VTVSVRDACACALESLNEPGRIVDGGQLDEQMDMVADDPDFDHAGAMALRFGEEERPQEVGDGLVNQWQARPRRPREVSVEAERHVPKMLNTSDGSKP
jgi:hypothetical protein